MKTKVALSSVVALSFLVLILTADFVFADKPQKCNVLGGTSDSDPSNSLGSKQNPYGSLADVEADVRCETIIILYSAVDLGGGISLRDGQELEGRKGPGGYCRSFRIRPQRPICPECGNSPGKGEPAPGGSPALNPRKGQLTDSEVTQ